MKRVIEVALKLADEKGFITLTIQTMQIPTLHKSN